MVKTTTLGGTAKDVAVVKVAHGLMLMHWTPNAVPDEQCFETIKASIDLAPPGAKMLLNSAQFYAQDLGTANLEMLSRFFEKYPEYADRVFLSVKGGMKPNTLEPDPSPEGIRRSLEICLAALRGTKRIDMFLCARIGAGRPVAEQMRTLVALKDEGHFDHIGMSECSARSVREAFTVTPIAAVEIEVSPWSYEEETRKVIATCKELGAAVIAYGPLGHGFLTGTLGQLPAGDMREHHARLQKENAEKNQPLVDALRTVADKKGISNAQLCIAWVAALGPHIIPMPGWSKPHRTVENVGAGGIELAPEDVKEIEKAIEANPVSGGRYSDAVPNEVLRLWA